MKIIVGIVNKSTAHFDDGRAIVIGRVPKYEPYVNIDDNNGNLIASITAAQMNKLVKAWQKAVGK